MSSGFSLSVRVQHTPSQVHYPALTPCTYKKGCAIISKVYALPRKVKSLIFKLNCKS